MLFRQLYDNESGTFTYVLGSEKSHQAIVIDPVKEHAGQYVQLLQELGYKLRYVLDTHVHADHITGAGQLKQLTQCEYVMGENSKAKHVDLHLKDGDKLRLDDIELTAWYTPGHTDDSYSFVMGDRVFTGDALLIRRTGRTDFQHGDAHQAFDSLFHKLLTLPDDTCVYPAHNCDGLLMSTIAEEKQFNPRLQVKSADEYAMRG